MEGRPIDDRSSWVGKAPNGQAFPDGAKRMPLEGAGSSHGGKRDYESEIRWTQNKNKQLMNSQEQPGYERN